MKYYLIIYIIFGFAKFSFGQNSNAANQPMSTQQRFRFDRKVIVQTFKNIFFAKEINPIRKIAKKVIAPNKRSDLFVSKYDIYIDPNSSLNKVITSSKNIREVGFRNCNFYENDGSDNVFNNSDFITDFLSFDSVYCSTSLNINQVICNKISISNSNSSQIKLSKCYGDVEINDCVIAEDIQIFEHTGSLGIKKNDTIKNRFEVLIAQSTINNLTYATNLKSKNYIHFAGDSLKGFISIRGDESQNEFPIRFSQCYIDAEILISGPLQNTQIAFQLCEFGPNARITINSASNIEFLKCFKFAKEIDIDIYKGIKIGLGVINTDVSKLNFNYLGNIKFYTIGKFEKDSFAFDYSVSTYEKILSKYKSEGMITSYKNMDIEYQDYLYHESNGKEKAFHLLNKYFWYYGYKKWLVLLWALGMIFFFWLINLLPVMCFDKVYPLKDKKWHNYYIKSNRPITYHTHRALRILLFTAVLFFSFNINFEKLKEQNNKLILWIFFQYTVGIIMLFFIFNAVIKL